MSRDISQAGGMPPAPGRLYGVSLGPGDPELITRAAWSALSRRDTVWVYPVRSGKTPSYARDIVLRAGLAPVAVQRALVFPMTHDAGKLARAWLQAAQQVLPWLQAGRDVLFLVEGDASTYATFGHLARTVRELDPRIETPVLAGVNAMTAACAAVGQPLAEQDDTVAVVPAAYGVKVLDRLLPEFDTLVLMKIKPLVDELLDWLLQRGLLDSAYFIERAGAADERTLSGQDLLQLRGTKVNYLSLMLVKSAHRVRGERIRGCLKRTPPCNSLPDDPAAADHFPEPDCRVCLLAITRHGTALARRLAEALPQAEILTSAKFVGVFDGLPNPVHAYQGALKDSVAALVQAYDQIICFVSLGAVVRLLAPHLRSKEEDPGVMVVDDAGSYVIPMLSGHLGGANEWAQRVAALLGATPVLTTASDVGGTIAVDILGRHLGWRVEAPKVNITRVSAAVVNAEPVALVQECGSHHWWTRPTPLPANIERLADFSQVRPDHHKAVLWVTDRPLDEAVWQQWQERLVVYRPPAGQQADDFGPALPAAGS